MVDLFACCVVNVVAKDDMYCKQIQFQHFPDIETSTNDSWEIPHPV